MQPHYQGSRANPKGLFSLDNLWDGLGALVVNNPDMRYFFGKVTMYGSYDKEARNILLYFLHKYFPDREHLVESIHPIELHFDEERFERMFCGGSYAEDYKILIREIRKYRENHPASDQLLYEPFPVDEGIRNGRQPRFRLCRGNRHPDHDQRHISEEIAAAFPIRSLKPSADSFRFRYGKDFRYTEKDFSRSGLQTHDRRLIGPAIARRIARHRCETVLLSAPVEIRSPVHNAW